MAARLGSALALTTLTLVACEPAFPPPPGFVEACYGGDFRKHLVGTRAKRLIVVKASESDWPRLASDLRHAGEQLGLEVFDTSVTLDHVHTIAIHLCSKNGIWISADQRKWLGEHAAAPNAHRDFTAVEISVNPYKDRDFDWLRVSDALAKILERSWVITVSSPP